MLRVDRKIRAPFRALAAFLLLSPWAFCDSSYSLVSALHGVSTNETVVEGATADGSKVTRTDSGSQALTPDWTWSYSATSTASAKDGELHGSSFIDIYCFNEPYCSDTVANPRNAYHAVTQSSYGDTVTLFSPTQNGKAGIAPIYFTVDGSITLTQLGAQTSVYGQVTLCDGFCGATNVISSIYYTNSSTNEQVLLGTIPIIYGVPFTFGANLFTRAQATFTSGTYAAVYLLSDFSNTAKFSGLGAYTADGELVTDVTAVSDSGFDYNPLLNVSPAPEPAMAGLVGMAMLGVLVWRARNGKSGELR